MPGADVLSFVEMDHFEEFQAALSGTHDGAFLRRPRKNSVDGSCLFWNRQRFQLVGNAVNVTFQDWEPKKPEVFHEDRVMLAVPLLLEEHVLVFASLHLMRNPEDTGKDAVRILEVSQMMKSLSCLVADVGAHGLVIMGDFNAVPESWTHTFLLHGWQDCPRSEKQMRGAFDHVQWECASCHEANPSVCTTRTNARSMWVDYIFYSSRTLELNEEPKIDHCPDEPIPDKFHPSDHLPLRAEFRLRPGALVLASPAKTAQGNSTGCTAARFGDAGFKDHDEL